MVLLFQVFSEVILPIVVIAGIGYALQSRFALDLSTLNRVSLYCLSPCLLFVTLLRTEVSGGEAARLALLMLLVVICMCAFAYALARLMGLGVAERSGFVLATTFMNSGNYGLPATRFAFGEVGFQYAVIGYLTQALLSQTLAVYVASSGSGNRRAALWQVLRMPMLYAALLALALRMLGIRLDESEGPLALGLYRGLRMVADATLPLLLLILGMQLRRRQPSSTSGPVGVATALRLGASVPIAVVIALLLGLHDLPLRVGVVQAAMPTAVNTTILALEFNAWPHFVSKVVVTTTLGSLLTLTLLIMVLQ
ncbi:AEC family transporter [Kallotenue papyrolyticum]|uniref:AEC family transporter n=1 Tax=Kallotenue papyrolyticum TaxID=1325125 RepID=UPI0004785D2C|nr:AEC family transporter [Kallotenue papyrolyticum]